MGCVCSKKETHKRNEEIPNQELLHSDVRLHIGTSRVPPEDNNVSPEKLAEIFEEKSLLKTNNFQPNPRRSLCERRSLDNSLYFSIKEAPEPDVHFGSFNSEMFYSLRVQGNTEYLESTVNGFNWDIDTVKRELIDRASREIAWDYAGGEFINTIVELFKQFIVKEALKCSRNLKDSEYFVSAKLPGPLDFFWIIAISHTTKYQELCEKLIGKLINRKEQVAYDLTVLPQCRFNQQELELDHQSTLWVNQDQFSTLLQVVYTKLQETQELSGNLIQEILFICRVRLNISKIVIRRKISGPKFHRFYKNASISTEEIADLITNKLAPIQDSLVGILSAQLPTSNNYLYIDDLITEYKRYMTMCFFSKCQLIPSSLVNYVWLVHTSFTSEYAVFSKTVFSRIIPYIHTHNLTAFEINDFKGSYLNTLDFYRFLYSEAPDEGIWPDANTRFGPNHTVCMWVSVFRVCNFIMNSKSSLELTSEELFSYVKEHYKVFAVEELKKEEAEIDSFFTLSEGERIPEILIENN